MRLKIYAAALIYLGYSSSGKLALILIILALVRNILPNLLACLFYLGVPRVNILRVIPLDKSYCFILDLTILLLLD